MCNMILYSLPKTNKLFVWGRVGGALLRRQLRASRSSLLFLDDLHFAWQHWMRLSRNYPWLWKRLFWDARGFCEFFKGKVSSWGSRYGALSLGGFPCATQGGCKQHKG